MPRRLIPVAFVIAALALAGCQAGPNQVASVPVAAATPTVIPSPSPSPLPKPIAADYQALLPPLDQAGKDILGIAFSGANSSESPRTAALPFWTEYRGVMATFAAGLTPLQLRAVLSDPGAVADLTALHAAVNACIEYADRIIATTDADYQAVFAETRAPKTLPDALAKVNADLGLPPATP